MCYTQPPHNLSVFRERVLSGKMKAANQCMLGNPLWSFGESSRLPAYCGQPLITLKKTMDITCELLFSGILAMVHLLIVSPCPACPPVHFVLVCFVSTCPLWSLLLVNSLWTCDQLYTALFYHSSLWHVQDLDVPKICPVTPEWRDYAVHVLKFCFLQISFCF